MKNPRIPLRLGKQLTIRFMDNAGSPIPKVCVYTNEWRAGYTLDNEDRPDSYPYSGIPQYADKEGLYQWDWAPDDEVRYVL